MTPEDSKYLVVDIETCPIDLEAYFKLPEEERTRVLNGVDSYIVAAGIRFQGKNHIMMNKKEKQLLKEFWETWSSFKRGDKNIPVVGFCICSFDLPMLVARSFINNVPVVPFLLKETVDLREKINAYKWRPRGKLKEFANLSGIEIPEEEGSSVAEWIKDNKYDKLKKYLKHDLEITDKVYQKALKLNITQINRWS